MNETMTNRTIPGHRSFFIKALSGCFPLLLLGAFVVVVVVVSRDISGPHQSLRQRRLQGWGPAPPKNGLVDPRTVERKPVASLVATQGNGGGWGQQQQQQQQDGWGPPPSHQGGFGDAPPPQQQHQQQQQQQGGYNQVGWGGSPPQQNKGFGEPPQYGGPPPGSGQTGLWSPPDQYQSNGPPPQQQGMWGGPPQQGGDGNPFAQHGGWGGTVPEQGGQSQQGPPPLQQQQQGNWGRQSPQNGAAIPNQGGNFEQQANFIHQQNPPRPTPPRGKPIHSSDPSYIQLCTEFLNRRDYNDGYQPSELFVIREPPEVCTSPDTFVALMTMMVSSMVAQASSMWRLSYQHGCETTTDLTTASIQQMLPNDLTLAMGAGIEAVSAICKKALDDPDALHRDGLYAFGFPKEGLYNVDPALNANRATAFRHNMYSAVRKVNRLESLLHVSPINQGAVIYMDVQSINVPHHSELPFSYFLSKVPKGIPEISIVVSPTCQTMPDCTQYASNLQEAIQTSQLFSSIPVHLEHVPSTSVAFARIMDAPVLICPPTMMCLLPAMWKPVQQTTYLSHSPELYPWFQYMVREAKKSFHLAIDYEKKD